MDKPARQINRLYIYLLICLAIGIIVVITNSIAYKHKLSDAAGTISARNLQNTMPYWLECNSSANCGYNQECIPDGRYYRCGCIRGWVSQHHDYVCNYKQRSQLVALILSLVLGFFGIDWYYLSCSNPWYIIAGILKFITLGGFGLWYLIDWIRVLAGVFPDGNGI